MAYSHIEVREYAKKLGKGERTLWRWIKQGCNLRDPKSVREWQVRNQIRETPIERARKRRRGLESHKVHFSNDPETSCDSAGNGELPPIGKKGAAAALERLEASEERAHARLEAALGRGNPVEVAAAQDFWLKCSETLRSRGRGREAPRGNAGAASGRAGSADGRRRMDANQCDAISLERSTGSYGDPRSWRVQGLLYRPVQRRSHSDGQERG